MGVKLKVPIPEIRILSSRHRSLLVSCDMCEMRGMPCLRRRRRARQVNVGVDWGPGSEGPVSWLRLRRNHKFSSASASFLLAQVSRPKDMAISSLKALFTFPLENEQFSEDMETVFCNGFVKGTRKSASNMIHIY